MGRPAYEGAFVNEINKYLDYKASSGFKEKCYVALPVLSAYLGHKTIFATEQYVRLTMSMYPYIEKKFKGKLDQVFSDMGVFNEND